MHNRTIRVVILFTLMMLVTSCSSKNVDTLSREVEFEYYWCLKKYAAGDYDESLNSGENLLTNLKYTTVIYDDSSITKRSVGAALEGLTKNNNAFGALFGGACIAATVAMFPPSWFFYINDAFEEGKNYVTGKGVIKNNNYTELDRLLPPFKQLKLFRALGHSAYQLKKYKTTIIYLKKAVELEHNFRITLRTEQYRQDYLATIQHDLTTLINALWHTENYAESLSYIEYNKARTSSELILSNENLKNFNSSKVNKVLLAKRQIEENLQKPTFTKSDQKVMQRSLNEFVNDSSLHSLIQQVNTSPIPAKRYKDLPLKTATISYYLTSNTLISIATHNGTIISYFKKNIDKQALQNSILRYIEEAKKNDINSFKLISNKLYSILFSGHTNSLNKKKIKHIVISPHNELHKLSFAGFYTGKEYLTALYSMSYTYSMNMLLLSTTVEDQFSYRAQQTVLFGTPMTRDEEPLQYAGKEIKEISAIVKPAEIYVRKKASKKRALQKLHTASVIHFAAHSYFNPKQGEKSYISLSKGRQLSTSGRLYASDINSITRIKPIELVVLSACNSGCTTISSDDDHSGLTRALFVAGTKRIVSTFWEISDQDSVELVTSFYSNLWEKDKSPSKALQYAALKTQKSSPDNLNWIAFKLEGQYW